jgi:hypothetical protein
MPGPDELFQDLEFRRGSRVRGSLGLVGVHGVACQLRLAFFLEIDLEER